MLRQHQRFQRLGSSAVVLALILAGAGHGTAAGSTITEPVIDVLSNRADLISGGDALVEIRLPDGAQPDDIRMELDGRDITHEFAQRSNGRYQGIVTGLRPGANQLTAWTSHRNGATITLTNHSKQGPIFAGEQVEPWLCETQRFGLGPAPGADCAAPTRYDYFYKSTATGRFESYDPASPPADALVAETTTDQGKTMPYIVRRERGVIDRGIYDIAVLYQPGYDWKPWAPQVQWNRKVHWLFDGGCNPGHQQGGGGGSTGTSGTDVLDTPLLDDLPLSRGYAVATSTLNWLFANCNDVVSAEAVMMTKEHLIEKYGPVHFTTSQGCSGGSIMQFLIANNYPGLLDGLMPYCAFPDLWTLASNDAADCTQLARYFNQTSPSCGPILPTELR